VNAYLDASVLVALFTNDVLSARAEQGLRRSTPIPLVSDFAAAELAFAVARRVRTRELTAKEARTVFSNFDAWVARSASCLTTTPADVAEADAYLRRLDLTLRTPDALNIALTQRAGALLATLDEKTALAARKLRVKLLPL